MKNTIKLFLALSGIVIAQCVLAADPIYSYCPKSITCDTSNPNSPNCSWPRGWTFNGTNGEITSPTKQLTLYFTNAIATIDTAVCNYVGTGNNWDGQWVYQISMANPLYTMPTDIYNLPGMWSPAWDEENKGYCFDASYSDSIPTDPMACPFISVSAIHQKH